MEKDLEKYLKILNSERCLKKPKEATIVIDKIFDCFNQEKSQFAIGLLIGLLLEEHNAIFSFIWKTSSDFETVSSTTSAFKLLDHLVTHFQSCMQPYFPVLFEKCLFILDTKFAKVKELSLKLIKNLIIADSKHKLDLSKLISELERHLREETKLPGSVAEQIYSLLGYLFEKYPESVKNHGWFLDKMCESLRHDCTVTKNPSLSRVKGAFEGIDGYLANHIPLNTETMKKIYEYIKSLSKFRQDRRIVSRTGLKILYNHWTNFSNFIYNDRDFWRINLEVWIKQKKDDRQPAFQFLCAFYSVIALFLKQNSNNADVDSYVKEFIETLESDSNSHEKRAALVGIKLFVLTESIEGENFSKTYEVLINFIKKHEALKSVAYFPLSVECVSAFVLKFSTDSVSVEQLNYLQRLSVKLIESYPTFEEDFQPDAVIALEKSFYMLGLSDLQIVENHMSRVLYQGLIRTCSSMTLPEIELLKETGETPSVSSYKSYLSLWKYVLNLASSPNLPVNGSFPLKKGIAGKVFDVFIESFLTIISKLNFNVDSEMEVEKPSDLRIFTNMVDLYQDLVPLLDPFAMQKWLMEIFKNVINLSYKNPLVSGFYKITETTLKVADLVQFFDDAKEEKKKSFELVQKFLEDSLMRVDQYKGELQISCLKVLLSAPVNVIESFAENTIPALEVTIQLSRSSFSLLKDLIDALERWDLYLPPTTSSKIMEKILPHFDVFFQNPYFRGNSSDKKENLVSYDSELLVVQKKFLMFLGHLDVGKSRNLIELSRSEDLSGMHFGDKHLMYHLPFRNGNVEISFNEILPRIIDLAMSCIDRKTRISACELLYSTVMLILGNLKLLSGGYSFLFGKVIKTCLVLGCDSDGVICQIFEPLMYQIVRYFSGKEALHFSETNDLIEILMDYVTRPYNPTVRDFSAHLLQEFIAWSVKQLTPEELKVTPESINRILEKIYSLALHPSFNKRLGAAVVFNKIYSILREEDFILNAYWFQLFYYFLESLRMCDGPEDVSEILEAIQHVKRPLVERHEEFNKDSPERVVPPEFGGGRLCHLVKWTLDRTCDERPTTRRTSMALVEEMISLIENREDIKTAAEGKFQNYFQHPDNSFREDFSEMDFVRWLKYQIAGFEFCTWLLEQKLSTIEEIFQLKFKAVLTNYMLGVLSPRENTPASDLPKFQSTLAFVTLLYAVKERIYLYPPEFWDFLKTALFTPTKLGFSFNQTATEHLIPILTELLKYLSFHVTVYDWDRFFKNLEAEIIVPVFGHITKNQQVTTKNLEFLFAFKVIEKSGLWGAFNEKMFFSMTEDFFILPIFKSLFMTRGKITYAVALEPSCKLYLNEILGILLQVSVSPKGVFNCLENEEEVREEETGKTVKKGEYFELVFKNTIFSFLGSKHDLLIEKVLHQGTVEGVKLLVKILNNESENSSLAVEILRRWEDFEKVKIKDWKEKKKLLFQMAVSSARIIGTPGFLKSSPLADRIYSILEEKKFEEMDISEIEGVFSLLPFLSDFAEGANENDRLNVCLSKFQVDQNALKELVDRAGFKFSAVKFAINGVLESLKMTASLILLRFIMSKAAWFDALCRKGDVEASLNVFSEKTELAHSVNALKLAYSFCFENQKTNCSISGIYKLFLHPLMKSLPSRAVYQLVNDNLEKLCDLLTTHWGEEKNLSKIKTNMVKKICAAGVFQTFVTKLTKEELDEMPRERRQLIDAVVKKVFFLLKHPYPPKVLEERYRKLMCEIFNMICCIISARCKDEKFYKLFIFDERGSFLYAAIDKTATINLDMDFDEIPKRKKHLTFLRETISKNKEGWNQGSVKYIQTNTLFSSSLQEDVTRFDLTHSTIAPMDSFPQENVQNLEIELEMDSLNSHECMATLVATISKMAKDKITPVDDVGELPCWLKFFLSVLSNSDLSENLKFFVLKVIYNVQSFVAPFCKQIFPGLLDSILELFKNHRINYFFIDLIEMMIGWMHVPEGEKSRWQLTELLVLILNKSDSLRRDIVKNNLEVLKTMIEVWKNVLHLPELSSVAFKRLSKSVDRDLKSPGNIDGLTYLNIHFCGVLLSNGIPAWKENTEKHFFDVVLKNFREDNKNQQIFGEICGLALNHLNKTKPNMLNEYEQLVRDRIFAQPSCWLQLLYGVHKRYPKISSMFTYRIFSSAWDSTDSLVVWKLEMLLSHVSRCEEAEDPTFERHVHVFLIDMLNSPDVAVLELSLQIAEKLIPKFDDEKLMGILKEVVRLQKSVHSEVRKWVYEISKKLYRKNNKDFVKLCEVILLRGLSDDVKALEESCLGFWRETLDFSSLDSTLLQILKKMYTMETEEIFLKNASKVLLNFAVDDTLVEKCIFMHPITRSSKFRKRDLVLTARKSLFLSMTFRKALTNQSLESVATLKHQNFVFLRPTASSLKFQPTVQENTEAVSSPPSPPEDVQVPSNPFKRRFYKSELKTNFSFANWQKNKKKKKLEEEEKLIEKSETEVDIFGEYRDGDFPDIQIRHSQILKLFEALARRDPQFARQLFVSCFHGLITVVKPQKKAGLLTEMRKTFEEMLKSSANFDPGVFGFVLQVILKHSQNLDVDCQLISNAALSSNCPSLGALIVEEIIANKDDIPTTSAKRRKGCDTTEETRWLELAKLYRSLQEYDVLSGIFLDKLKVEKDAKEAIRCESVLNWLGASKGYESVLRTNPDSTQSEFYTESYFECLTKLSNWSLVNKCVRSTVSNDLEELWKNYNLLSWFLKSEMMISLGTEKTDFLVVLEEFFKNGAKRNILSKNFGEELAVFDWLSNKLQRSNYRIDRLCLDFLSAWSHVNRWSYNLRTTKLTSLQALAELSFAVENLSEVSRPELEKNIKIATKRWQNSVPAPRDDLTIWDVKLNYRREFLRGLKDFDLTELEVRCYLALAKAALSQENLNLAKVYLTRVQEKLPKVDESLKAEHDNCFNLGKMVVAKMKMSDENVGLGMFLNVWRGISKQISTAMETDSESLKSQLYNSNLTLGQLVSEILPSVKNQSASEEVLRSVRGMLGTTDEMDISVALHNKGLEYLENARKTVEDMECSSAAKANTYLELSKFILKFSDSATFADTKKLCTYLLRGMSLGSTEARQLFGCFLNMSDLIPEESSLEEEIEESNRVPSWMFLTWINQMLASLNTKMFELLKTILLRLTQDYPNAIRYALKLTEENLKSKNPKLESFFQKANEIVSKDKLYDDFWIAMKYLVPPDLFLIHHLEEAFQEINQEKPDFPGIKTSLTDLHRIMFSEDYRKFRGPIFKFWEKFQKPFEDVLNNFSKKQVLKKKLKSLLTSIGTSKMPSKRSLTLLESYSPWLYNFHYLKAEAPLEVPGQYDGSREPIKKYLVTISSFKNSLLVFDSKCRPMRITLLGNDASEHTFLIKFGEDLRQDERIQQVFQHVNSRLSENKQTRRFHLDTYKVIPLTLNLGMIEWIDNTASLHEMIQNSLGDDTDAMAKAQQAHLSFLSSPAKSGCLTDTIAAHLLAYEKIKRDAAVSNFRVRVQGFPKDLLKRSFMNVSTSPEHFIHLRSNFATSYAVMCVTHWLIGIGDRHLQNILVSTQTGRALGIDFGYAFGFATQFLTPPELIPFRLTPQILAVLHPLNESGWIKQTMIHCLRLFRKDDFRLLSVLEVFAREPVMDWLKQAKKSKRFQADAPETWYPREKVSLVKKKLSGANPVSTFQADLQAGHAESKYYTKYLEVLKGFRQDNIRLWCGDSGLSEEQQVECLIDLATDPHVLAKTFIGWNAWL